ncbi:MAG: TIGR00725 family protein [Dethiobacteria bacterium]
MVYIGVIGAGECDEKTALLAYEVGKEIALSGAILVCGGRGGVMEAACRGCKDFGGVSLGILPGRKRQEANPFVSYVLATGMGEMRNFLVVRCSDVLIAISGKYGTLSEIAIALKEGKSVFALQPFLQWPDPGEHPQDQPQGPSPRLGSVTQDQPQSSSPRLVPPLQWPDLEVVFSPQEAVKRALSCCEPT